jgi:hypothetical protein
VVRAEPPQDGFGSLLRGRMERRGAAPHFIARGCAKQGTDLEGKIRSVKRGKKSDSRRGEEEDVVWHAGPRHQ